MFDGFDLVSGRKKRRNGAARFFLLTSARSSARRRSGGHEVFVFKQKLKDLWKDDQTD